MCGELLCVVFYTFALLASDQPGTTPDFELTWHTIDGGGAMFTAGGVFEVSGTIGQPDVGVDVLSNGSFELTGGFWPAAQACGDSEPPHIVHAHGLSGETRPFSGYIDPRWEAQFGGNAPPVDSVTLVFNEPIFDNDGGPLTAANFSVTETGGGAPPTVASIITSDNIAVTVVLSRPITQQKWTTVIADVADANGCNQIVTQGNLGVFDEPDRVDVGFLPGDIDQNHAVQPVDLLRFRQFIAGTCTLCPHITSGGLAGDYFDIDRDGDIDPGDLLRYRQLIFGSGGAMMPWSGATLGARP